MDCSPPDSPDHGILQMKYWSGLPLPSPGDLPNPGFEPVYSRQILYRQSHQRRHTNNPVEKLFSTHNADTTDIYLKERRKGRKKDNGEH